MLLWGLIWKHWVTVNQVFAIHGHFTSSSRKHVTPRFPCGFCHSPFLWWKEGSLLLLLRWTVDYSLSVFQISKLIRTSGLDVSSGFSEASLFSREGRGRGGEQSSPDLSLSDILPHWKALVVFSTTSGHQHWKKFFCACFLLTQSWLGF